MVDLVRLYAAPDVVMCWSFSLLLKRKARDWVATPTLWSIRTFDEPSKSFVTYFLSRKRKMKTAIEFMQVIHEKYESLQEYLTRFSRATLGIKDLQTSTVETALMNETQS